MRPAGLAAFEARSSARKQIYSYERRGEAALDAAQERAFRANRGAWDFFQAQPPGYRRTAIYWIATAKLEETRARRLAALVGDSAAGRRLGMLDRRPGRKA
jgi:uncharacterized protein YdeI (YjbR/CyaY-like superfamily)